MDPPPSHDAAEGEAGDGSDLLAAHAAALADAVERVLPAWVERCVRLRCHEAGVEVSEEIAAAAAAAGIRCRDQVAPAVRDLLGADPDEQPTTPLSLLRAAVVHPTVVLAAAGVPPVDRDEFARRSFPQDVYDLTPASFAAIDESLHEPGLTWGAAKAHVHLRRRRAEGRS